ncbi:hypothetical protein JFL47_08340 [Haemophilus haemoglobinophilus]|nr:hypothetical protein [Canicola haemoglobinophilus]
MNKHFKMTALAIVVSFGLTGCWISNDSSADVKRATPIAKGEQGKPQTKPTTKPEESKPTTKPEESKPTIKPEESKPTTKPGESKPTTKPEDSTPTTKPEDSTPTTKPEETKPQPEPEKIVSVDSTGETWRIVAMNGRDASTSDRTVSVQRLSELGDVTVLITPYREVCNSAHGVHCRGYALDSSGVNAVTKFDLNELAQKDGKPFLGVHSGSHTDNDFSGYVIDAYTNEKGERVITKEDAKTVNYLFVNQPYSSYGMLYTNQNDIASFYQGLRAGEEVGYSTEFDVYNYEVKQGQRTGRILWNDNVKGNATYKGNVIATVATYEPPHFEQLTRNPEVDGTITLNAQFGELWERTYITGGELDSKTIGKVALPKTDIESSLTANSGSLSKEMGDNGYKLEGSYSARFVGKDLNDVIGEVRLSRENSNLSKGNVVRYNAVFGATKQPKAE